MKETLYLFLFVELVGFSLGPPDAHHLLEHMQQLVLCGFAYRLGTIALVRNIRRLVTSQQLVFFLNLDCYRNTMIAMD